MPGDNDLTTAQAAAAAGVSVRAIVAAIAGGALTATRWGGQWSIKPADLEAWRNNPAAHIAGARKLTESDVREIRRMREGGATLQAIADRYGIDDSNVHRIVTRRTWKHIE